MQRRKLCTRPGCTWPRYRKKLCPTHYRQDYPATPTIPAAKPRKPLRKTPAAKKGRRHDKVPAPVGQTVLERCGGLCEACGGVLDGRVHLHHRQRRRDGGHTADNLVALHPECHVVAPQAVHQRPTWARERGLIVPSWANPSTTPLVLSCGRTVLLHLDQPVYLEAPGLAA